MLALHCTNILHSASCSTLVATDRSTMACAVGPIKVKLTVAALLVLCIGSMLGSSSALPSDMSIVGYSPEDLSSHGRLMELFERWLSRHGKAYATLEEKLRRFEVFRDNLHHIDETNRKVSSYWLGLNEFADLTHDEFKATHLGVVVDSPPADEQIETTSSKAFRYEQVDASSLPKSVDWRKKGAVTAVKNQGQCGSCWAFSTVAAVEGINQIVTGNLTALSEQQLIDCATDGNNGCNGGIMDNAFSYIAHNGGLRTEDAYPYLMEEGSCRHQRREEEDDEQVVTISGYEDVPRNNEQALLKALAHQPVSVAIEASGRSFQFYAGGVFDGPCGTALDHGVAAVGYDRDSIIVKNSWGPTWGEKGYIRMKRGTGKRHGLCGINKMASYPTKN